MRRKIPLSAAQLEECGMTVYHVLWPNFYLSDNYWVSVWVFVHSSVLSCVISWNEKCCDVLYHSYVDPASICRILPQIWQDPDPNRIQIHWIRPDPDPVHPYWKQQHPPCTGSNNTIQLQNMAATWMDVIQPPLEGSNIPTCKVGLFLAHWNNVAERHFSTTNHKLASLNMKRFRSASPKVHYSKACVPKLVYKLAEACYISVTGTNPNPKP